MKCLLYSFTIGSWIYLLRNMCHTAGISKSLTDIQDVVPIWAIFSATHRILCPFHLQDSCNSSYCPDPLHYCNTVSSMATIEFYASTPENNRIDLSLNFSARAKSPCDKALIAISLARSASSLFATELLSIPQKSLLNLCAIITTSCHEWPGRTPLYRSFLLVRIIVAC